MTVAGDDLIRDVERLAKDVAHGLRDETSHAGGEPLLDELARDPDDEGVAIEAKSCGVLQPGLEIGASNVYLKLSAGSIPYSLSSGFRHFTPPWGLGEGSGWQPYQCA